MKRLLLVLLALGAVAVGVLFALGGRSPGEPPPVLEDRFMRVKVEKPQAELDLDNEQGEYRVRQEPGSVAPGTAMLDPDFDQAPRGAVEAPGAGGERIERSRRVAPPDAQNLDGLRVGNDRPLLNGDDDDRKKAKRRQAMRNALEGLEREPEVDEDNRPAFEIHDPQAGKGRGLIIGHGTGGMGLHGLPADGRAGRFDDNKPVEDLAQDDLPQKEAADEPVRLGAYFGRKAPPEEVSIKTLKQGYLADLKDKSESTIEEAQAPIDLGTLELDGQAVASAAEDRPEQFLPRMCYFENTYLGGNAAYQERLRRLEADLAGSPHLLAALEPQPFDAPEDAGLRLTATLDHTHLDRPGRVMLQVGLQGSRRFGWRRPPLDVVLLVDAGASEALVPAADALLKRLGPQDRLAIVQAGEGDPVVGLADRRTARTALARHVDRATGADDVLLERALTTAGRLLTGADDQARVPGTRTLVLVTGSGREARIERTRAQVQALAEQGVVTSVVAMSTAHDAGWWQVASAGNGNLHRALGTAGLGEVMEAELASLARVIARLLRVNIRLAPGTEGVRILGSRVLGQDEVREVKAREVATDRNLSRALGVKADRGEDDDGIQTVIPYFYGGDSHVILVELWVDKPGAVAEISLKYKDMVNLENATARTSVALTARPRGEALAQTQVLRNLRGFDFAAALKEAGTLASQGESVRAQLLLRARAQTDADRRLGEAFVALMQRTPRADLVSAALALAADRRIGASP